MAPVPRGLMPRYNLSVCYESGGLKASTLHKGATLLKKGGAPPPQLRFTSSWFEDEEDADLTMRTDNEIAGGGLRRRYVRITFDSATGESLARIENEDDLPSVDLPISSIRCEPSGRAAGAWDLHVGARIRVLGKRCSIQQVSKETGEWLEDHARV